MDQKQYSELLAELDNIHGSVERISRISNKMLAENVHNAQWVDIQLKHLQVCLANIYELAGFRYTPEATDDVKD
jgi:hypothetical protein